MKLHIGGEAAIDGWTVVNVQPMEHVDIVADCRKLAGVEDDSVSEIYASHILEHLSYSKELPAALLEFHRVLQPGGTLRVSVPDLDILCRLFISPHLSPQEQFHLMRVFYGGQTDEFDYHRVGFTGSILASYAHDAGFINPRRVGDHGMLDDCSRVVKYGTLISLNMEFDKSPWP